MRAWLLAFSVALAVLWAFPLGVPALLAKGVVVVALAGLVAHRTPGATLAAASLALFAVTESQAPGLSIAYPHRLRLEAMAALLPPLAFVGVWLLVRRHGTAAHGMTSLALGLAMVGALVRLLETWLLFGRPGDAATIEHALRLDLATSVWSVAAWAVAFAVLARWLPDHRPRAHRASAWMGAFVGFLVVTSGSPAMLESGASPSALAIGFHADDVSAVPEGADVVHLEAAMPRVEYAQGHYDFEELDAQMAAADARGLRVYLLVSTYPPRWLQHAYPESVMTDAEGEPFLWIDESPAAPHSGRVWDMSYADERVFKEKADYVRALVARYGDHPSVDWVAVVNEPAYPVGWNLLRWASFDEATVGAFRESLRNETGGSLVEIEERYGVEFDSWLEVEPPRVPLGRFGDRWMAFREELLVAHTVGLMDVAREHTGKPVTTKLAAHFLTRFAEPQAGLSDWTYRQLAAASDVVSIDLYPVTQADLVRQLHYFDALAEGKQVIVAEFNLAFGTQLPFAGLRMLSALEAISRVADVAILFTASGHFLYGIDDESAAMEATRMVRLGFTDSGYGGALREMWKRELVEMTRLPAQARDAGSVVLGMR